MRSLLTARARTSVRIRIPDFSPAKTAGFLLTFALVACAPKPSAQCGVASLANILARVGRPLPYADLLHQTRVEAGHNTFTDLAETARRAGVAMRGYRLSRPADLRADDLGIVELVDDHFVALVDRQGDSFGIVDSPDGAVRAPESWSAARLEAAWTGNVLLVEHPSGARTLRPPKEPGRSVRHE